MVCEPLPVCILNQVRADRLARPFDDPGDDGRQFARNLDFKSSTSLILRDSQRTVMNIRSLELEHVGRSLASEQRQVHCVRHREMGLRLDLVEFGVGNVS